MFFPLLEYILLFTVLAAVIVLIVFYLAAAQRHSGRGELP